MSYLLVATKTTRPRVPDKARPKDHEFHIRPDQRPIGWSGLLVFFHSLHGLIVKIIKQKQLSVKYSMLIRIDDQNILIYSIKINYLIKIY